MATVLLVDDELFILRAIQRMLVRRGIDVIGASSGDEALLQLARNDITCIVSDYRMPAMTGVSLLRQVRVMSPRAGRVIMTGQADQRALTEARLDGTVHRVVDKPFTYEALIAAIVEAQAIGQSNDVLEAS